jgi:hippurate hydrolase
MASADQFDLFITGKGTHAAYPELGNNPVVLASLVPAAFNAIARRRSVNRNNRVVISVTSVHTGDAYNVIPETAHLRGTLRTLDMGVRKKVLDDIAKTLRSLARKTRGTFNLRYLPVKIPVTCNDASAVEFSKKACERVYPKRAIGPVDHPTMGTEDFAYMLQVKRGAYLWMGSKDPSGPQKFLHNPYYDFNDKALVLGASIWTALAEEYLKQ